MSMLWVHWFLKCQCSLLPSPVGQHPIYLDSWTNISGSYEIWFFIALDFTFTTRHIHNWVSFLLWPSCFILSGAIGNWPLFFPSSILDTFWPGGVHLLVSYRFSFSYCLWGFQGKNTGVGCHFLLQRTTICQNSSLWPVRLGWPYTAWFIASLSYTSPFAMTSLWSNMLLGKSRGQLTIALVRMKHLG